jgi:peptide/nickel transport system ATP-binding protein
MSDPRALPSDADLPVQSAPLLKVTDLCTYFYTEEGELRAVDGVSFELSRGRTLALVGESGCGKSVTASSLLRLINPPGKIVGGSVRLQRGAGEEPLEILTLKERSEALREVRGGRVAFIFQEATAALSPVHSIGNQIIEAIRLHQKISRRGAARLALDLLDRVGIADPALCLTQYPHQLSGGMRQRALIAMALSSDPEILIADEPTTALDVTKQAQILALLQRLQADLGMAMLLITHDLGVVAQMADEVLVMYLGRVVERGSVRTILEKPRHPYSMGLLASLPSRTPVGQRLPSIPGAVPALNDIPPGCPFHPRCAYAEPGRCNTGGPPPLLRVGLKPTSPAGRAARADVDGAARDSVLPGLAAEPDADAHDVACWRVREIVLERLLRDPLPAIVARPVPGVAAELPRGVVELSRGVAAELSRGVVSRPSRAPAPSSAREDFAELPTVPAPQVQPRRASERAASGASARPEVALGNPVGRASPSTALGIGKPFQAHPQPGEAPTSEVQPGEAPTSEVQPGEAPTSEVQPSQPAASDPLTLTPLLDDTELAWFEAGERLSGHPGTERSR